MKLSQILRFDPAQINNVAARYAYADDGPALAAGESARARGWYTKAEFLSIRRWKSSRGTKRAETVDEVHLREASAAAIAAESPAFALGALVTLPGVREPVASTLLHFAKPDAYPILDRRALWSLSIDCGPHGYAGLWPAYVALCRGLAQRHGVSVRVLDQALWQYSREQQPGLDRTG